MARGGARAGSGPDPDPLSFRTAQRRAAGEAVAAAAGWIVLPVTGRPGPPPEWPLTDATARELELWARLWAKPQATRWEVLGVEWEVALYVRRLVDVEQPGASAAASNLLMRLAESLGLSLPGLQARKWHLGGVRTELASVTPLPNDPRPGERTSSRDRFRPDPADVRDRLAGPFRRPDRDEAAAAAGDED